MKSKNFKPVLILILLLSAFVSVQAQKKGAQPAKQQQPAQAEREDFKQHFIKATEDYKASLQVLLASYENDVKRLDEKSSKLKELYNEGLISRREFEASQSSILEAQAKVDEVHKQIATADLAIAEAKKAPTADELQLANIPATESVRSWTTGNARIDGLIRLNGARYNVDPYFIYCVIHQESRFNSVALSPKGAQGLMQLMPGTAARYGVINPNDPAQNIMGGTRYLKDLLQLFRGRIDLVLASYNAGEGAVIKYGQRIPPYKETQDYVRLISARYLNSPGPAPAAKKKTTRRRSH